MILLKVMSKRKSSVFELLNVVPNRAFSNRNRTIFGNDSFRENQKEIINATKSGKDVLALIPTGGGKSLTF